MSTRTSCGILLRVMAALAFVAYAVPVAAQTPYIPYFGKNQIRYDKFEWFHYETDHFVIYDYPEIEPHLERMAGYARARISRSARSSNTISRTRFRSSSFRRAASSSSRT